MIGIVDYESGNLGSVSNACRFLEIEAKIIQRPEELDRCQAMILPGVGAFGDCVDKLAGHGFAEPVVDWIAAGKPFLGICVGLQILFEGSEEAPDSKGLGVLPGMIRKFDVPEEMKVPQIGWNRVRQCRPDCPLFDNIPDESWFYFVHSYRADLEAGPFVAGSTDYGHDYASVVWKDNLTAVQFHPEKSQKLGLALLKNFASSIEEGVLS